jgi:hypothetical protein
LKFISERRLSELTGLLGEGKPAAQWLQNRLAMEPPARYFDVIREMRDGYNHRLRLVQYTRQHGVKARARNLPITPTERFEIQLVAEAA